MRSVLRALGLSSLIFSSVAMASWFSPKEVTQADEPPLLRYAPLFQQSRAMGLEPKVLKLALAAYERAKARHLIHRPTLTVVDYTKPSNQPRLWVIDMNRKSFRFHTHVAHGQGSGDLYARSFSNQNGTHQSSLGVFLTGGAYHGNHGFSLRLHGLDKGINDRAYQRAIVFHPAPYVSEQFAQLRGRLGRSWGCLALNPRVAAPVIRSIQNGSLVFAYYPDRRWLSQSPFVRGVA